MPAPVPLLLLADQLHSWTGAAGTTALLAYAVHIAARDRAFGGTAPRRRAPHATFPTPT